MLLTFSMRSRHSPLSTQSISVHSNPSLKTKKNGYHKSYQFLSVPNFRAWCTSGHTSFEIVFGLQPQSLNIKKDVVLATDYSIARLEGVFGANVISLCSKTWNVPYFNDHTTFFLFQIVMFSELRCVVFLLLPKLTHFLKGKNEGSDPFL